MCCILLEGSIMDHGLLAQLTQLYMTVKLECPFYRVCIYEPGLLNQLAKIEKKNP